MDLTLHRLLSIGESGLGLVKSLGTPIGVSKTVCGLGSKISYISAWSEKNVKALDFISGPPEIAALAVEGLNLIRCLVNQQSLSSQAGKITELALSILKKVCETLKWMEKYSLVSLEAASLGRLDGIMAVSELLSTSLSLRQELGDTPPTDKDLYLSLPKVLKASLLIYVYLFDNKSVKMVAAGIGVAIDGYSLYKRSQEISFNPKNWHLTHLQIYQIITSIALAGIALYAIQKDYFPIPFNKN